MNHYKHLTTEEREKASNFRVLGLSIRAIAQKLGRTASTISREFKKNCKKNGEYSPSYAETLYCDRKSKCGAKRKLSLYSKEKEYITTHLALLWSPEQIVGRASIDLPEFHVCVATIYNSIANGTIKKTFRKCLRYKNKKNKKKNPNDKRGKPQNITSIHDRPIQIDYRTELGHFESDTVLGMRNTGCFATHVDRLSGVLLAHYLLDRKDNIFNTETIKVFANLPLELKKSFTVDNGKEFFNHKELAEKTGMIVYFCDPFSSWQRGCNENTNGLLRQFFPKKSSFEDISDLELQFVVSLINNRPRKRFGWLYPLEFLQRFS